MVGVFYESLKYTEMALGIALPFEHHFGSDVIRSGLFFRMQVVVC